MSHGPAGEGRIAEPNLTPLLDVVLQLLMFFMMCVNFVTEQVSEDIRLPESTSARPMDKAETDVLFVNLKPFQLQDFSDRLPPDALSRLQEKFQPGDACVSVVGGEPMKRREVKVWRRDRFEEAQKNSGGGKVNTAIIIRAHQDSDYGQVFQLLQMCKVQGYTNLKLRAITRGGQT